MSFGVRVRLARACIKLIASALIAALCPCCGEAATPYDQLVVSHNPVAYWRLGELSGTTAQDETGNYDGTYYGPILGQLGTVATDKAAAFDGVDDYVDVGTPTVGGSEITITAWIKADDFDVPDATILSKKKVWTVLLVVIDPASLTAQEADRRTLIESWGYQVNLIAASASQASFDAAVTDADVAYVSEQISDTQLNTKLKDAPIGVVNEEGGLHDDFGIAGDIASNSDNKILILDDTHHITSGYTVGITLVIIQGALQPYNLLDGNLASGLQQLAETKETGSQYRTSLAVLEVGASLYGGGVAAGRRVALPWGGSGFDINKLNTNGQTIMQRAIDWAAGRDALNAESERHYWTLATAESGGQIYLSFLLKTSGSTTTLTDTSQPLETGRWIFAAAVYDGSTMKLYKDGLEVASVNRTGMIDLGSNVLAWIGDNPRPTAGSGQAKPFDGRIDEVAIFDRALSPTELQDLNQSASTARGVRILKWVEIQ